MLLALRAEFVGCVTRKERYKPPRQSVVPPPKQPPETQCAVFRDDNEVSQSQAPAISGETGKRGSRTVRYIGADTHKTLFCEISPQDVPVAGSGRPRLSAIPAENTREGLDPSQNRHSRENDMARYLLYS